VVLDLGANVGLFGAYVLERWPGSRIRGFEPDPANFAILERTIAGNGFARRWSVERAAVADREAELSFAAGLFAVSRLLPGDEEWRGTAVNGAEVITVPGVDLFARESGADLMKMDIEGGEWAILSDPRFHRLRVTVLVLEWHAESCPFPDPRGAALRLLQEAGYRDFEEIGAGTESGLLWAWRDLPANP
jgi:FkbM family methyltransferase